MTDDAIAKLYVTKVSSNKEKWSKIKSHRAIEAVASSAKCFNSVDIIQLTLSPCP